MVQKGPKGGGYVAFSLIDAPSGFDLITRSVCSPPPHSPTHHRGLGWGKIGLRGGGGSLEPLSRTPPLLGSRDGALKKVIDDGK